jgi:hypothetical protein
MSTTDSKIIIRFNKPTILDYFPYKTIIQVNNTETGGCQYFIQSSKNDKEPQWVTLGQLLEHVLSDNIHKTEFINQCLESYNDESEENCVIVSFK